MTDRTVRVALTAATQQFEAAMRSAQASVSALEKELESADKAARKAEQGAKSFGEQMRDAHRAGDLSQMAGQVGKLGAAWTAANAIVAKTGIEYNTLQQTSRAALTTLTGSAEAANAQMDKLDAFARTSPFSKSVFITAQQQMLAFGIEAEKVIPYLSAINEAVAAAGGNNETLAQISYVMAQISAQGKITAVDLMQLGNAGINAAELIGSQMGKTGAAIKESITAGTLDADAALDALAAGMSERFAGAAANVKDTMAGALDRVKAAFRDLSAEMLSGAVDPNGGGWLVDWTNQLANLLRTAQKVPQPIKDVVGAISGVGGVSLLAVAGILKLVDAGMSMHDTWTKLGESNEKLQSALGKLGGAFKVAAASALLLSTVGKGLSELVGTSQVQNADAFARALERAVRSGGDLANMEVLFKSGRRDFLGSDDLVAGINSVTDAMEALRFSYESGGIHFDRFIGRALTGLFGAQTEVQKLEEVFAGMDAQLAAMEDRDAAAEVFSRLRDQAKEVGLATHDLLSLFPEYANAVQNLAAANELGELSGEELADAMAGVHPALLEAMLAIAGIEGAAGGAVEPIAELTEQVRTLGGAMVEATEDQLKYWESIGQAGGAFIDVIGAYDQVIAKNKELAQAEADAANASTEAKGDMKKSWEDFIDGHKFSFDQYMENLREQAAAQAEWQANLAKLAGQVSDDVLLELASMGPKAAPLLAELAQQPADVLAEWEAIFRQSNLGEALGASLDRLGPLMRAATENAGQEAVDALQAKLAAGLIDLPRFEVELDLLARTEEEIAKIEQMLAAERQMTINLTKPHTYDFDAGMEEVRQQVASSPATMTVEADTEPAEDAKQRILDQINNATGTLSVDGDTNPAMQETRAAVSWIDGQEASIRVNADASAAENAARAALDRISRMSATVQIRAHHASGFHAPVATGGRVGDVAAAYGLAGGGSWGGYVRGAGTATSDEAAMVALSRDEFVLRAWAASRIGAADLYYMNTYGQLPPRREQNLTAARSVGSPTTYNQQRHATHVHLGPGSIQIHGLNAVHAVEELQRELAGRFEQTGGRHG